MGLFPRITVPPPATSSAVSILIAKRTNKTYQYWGSPGFRDHRSIARVEQFKARLKHGDLIVKKKLRLARQSNRRDQQSPGPARTRISARRTAALSASLQSPQFRLSPRECNLATLVAQGCQNNEIATILSITERTVRLHWNHVCREARDCEPG